MFIVYFLILFLPVTIFLPTFLKFKGNQSKVVIKKSKCVIVSNHMSIFDPVVLQMRLKKKIFFLAKIEAFKNKLFSCILKRLGAIPVDRKNPSISSIKNSIKVLKDNKPLCIFVQGTRSKSALIKEGEVKEGAGMFALKEDAPIIPIAFTKKVGFFRFSKIVIGEPIYLDKNKVGDKEYLLEVSNLIRVKINELIINDKKD